MSDRRPPARRKTSRATSARPKKPTATQTRGASSRTTSPRPATKRSSKAKPRTRAASSTSPTRRAASTPAKRKPAARKPAPRRPVARAHHGPDSAKRIRVVGAVFAAIALLFVASLVDLQALSSDRYVSLGEKQRTRTENVAAYRGSILDRDGFVLAASTPAKRVIADPTMIVNPVATAALLAPALGVDAAVLTEQLTPDSDSDRYAELARYLDEDGVDRYAVTKENADSELMAGIFLQSEEQRVYPAGTLARPLVGAVDPDEIGTFGVEFLYNEVMTGVAGSKTHEEGAGKYGSISVGDFVVDPAREGYDVVLTIDHRLQYVVEQALIEHCEETRGNWATAVGSDPRTGEILFMGTAARNEDGTCSVPNYNAALIKTFEPGSVMKAVTVAAAVEELGIDRNSTYEVPQSLQVGDTRFTQGHEFPAARYPLIDIIANSMNIGTMLMARDLGPYRLYDYMTAFGIGQPTGIEFKGEARGSLRDPDEWYDSNMGSIPIGQGVSTNAVELLSAYNALANDGLFVSPKLVRALVSADGQEIVTKPQTSTRAASAATADEVTAMLQAAVERGTGQAAAIPGYSVAGKTGTAWKAYDDGSGTLTYGEDGTRRYTVTFAGFVPAENPQLSMVVVVDEPQSNTTAGLVAAPLFHDIGLYALRILGIPPTDASQAETDGLVRATPTEDPVDEEAPVEVAADSATEDEEGND